MLSRAKMLLNSRAAALSAAIVAIAVVAGPTQGAEPRVQPAPADCSPPGCEARFNPPYRAIQAAEFYTRSSHYTSCKSAAKRLLAFRWKTGEYEVVAKNPKDEPAYRQMMNRYVSSCLFDTRGEAAGRLLDSANTARIRASVGYFYATHSRQPLFCNGVVIKNRVLTARHCFLDAQGGVSVSSRVRFRLLDDAGEGSAVSISTTFHPGQTTFDTNEDWLVLDLQNPRAADRPRMGVQSARLWDETILVAFDPRVLLLRRKVAPAADGKAVATPPPQQLFADLSPLCRIAAIQEGLLMHACQSEAGTSGSPLFAIGDDGTIAVVGVQSGRSAAVANASNAKLTEFFPNYATALPAAAIQRLMSE